MLYLHMQKEPWRSLCNVCSMYCMNEIMIIMGSSDGCSYLQASSTVLCLTLSETQEPTAASCHIQVHNVQCIFTVPQEQQSSDKCFFSVVQRKTTAPCSLVQMFNCMLSTNELRFPSTRSEISSYYILIFTPLQSAGIIPLKNNADLILIHV